MSTFTGIFIENHKTLDADSKAYATQNLTDWQTESCTPADWVKKLENGQTIQPSAFSPQPDGTYTHKFKYWNSTHFVCADADNIKGVEKLEDGSEKNPNGVDKLTDSISMLYPDLKSKAFAVGQSVSSMAEWKPPPHLRYRLIFLFDKAIESKEHYHQILLSLSNEFPIISNDKRTPSQPVFGNAREGFGFRILENVLSLDDYPCTPASTPASTTPSAQTTMDVDITLESYLRSHRVVYTPCTEEQGKYFVECPNKSNHTGAINKPKDAYVFDDGKAWAFNCSHTSCKKNGDATWDAFKRGNGISNRTPKFGTLAKTPPSSEPELNLSALPTTESNHPEFPDTQGDLFLGTFQFLYNAYAETHIWSPEMIMAMGLGTISHLAGRETTVRTHDDANAENLNTYILAVGESDLTGKSAALSEIRKFISHCDYDFSPISNVLSLEGIVGAMTGEGNPAWQYCLFDESSVLFTNARREGTKNLLSGLNELWLCPPTYRTAKADLDSTLTQPYLNCWGNIPTLLIPSVFRQEDMIAGTLNRWLPFYISPKIETVRHPHAIADLYDAWIQYLKSVFDHETSRAFIFNQEADDARFDWYDKLRRNAIQKGIQTGESRFHTHAVKIAGIFALADNAVSDNEVKITHWDAAIGVTRYLADCYDYLFKSVGATRMSEIEIRILEILNDNGNEMTLSALNRKTQSFDIVERDKVLDLLEKNAIILRYKQKSKGRPSVLIRRVS